MHTRLLSLLLVGAAATLVIPTRARSEDAQTSIKFSDPTKPGTVKIALARGNVEIRGTDASEVTVTSDAPAQTSTPRSDGLRVLTASASFSVSEKNNVVTVDALSEGWTGVPTDFRLTVPRGANVVVSSSIGGDVSCRGVTGDVEIKSLNGEVTLDGLAGGALVETTNGEITAEVQELHDNKPLSFTSTNGAVVLRLPTAAKANVRLRTQNGTILTDFDDKALVTKVQAVAGHRGKPYGMLTPEAREAFREAARAGAEAARRAAEAVREAAEAAREGANGDGDQANGHGGNSPAIAPLPPIPPIPAIASIPTITGGKIVSGTLNGGGPEISVATMNGDITLRKSTK